MKCKENRVLRRTQTLLSVLDRFLGLNIRALLYRLSPLWLARYRYILLKGKKLELDDPKSFDEKLLWLNIYWRHPLKAHCADKYAFRSYVTEHGYGYALPKLLGVYDKSKEIDFDALPYQFVLKCTHGCKFNIICTDKSKLDVSIAKRRLDKWMRINISRIWGEIHYDNIKPRILCEEFLKDSTGELPIDYKVCCFNGKAQYTMIALGRDFSGNNAKYDFYDLKWENRMSLMKSNMAVESVKKPKAYDEMIAIAEELSKPFPFVRVDFYSINDRAIVGEMTFTPDGCIDLDLSDEGQRILGDLVRLQGL